jgi:hypothetical protein
MYGAVTAFLSLVSMETRGGQMNCRTIAIVACLLAVVSPKIAGAQISGDSASVVVAAFDDLLGKPPFDHPGGKAAAVCIDIQPSRAWSQHTWTQDPAFIEGAKRKVAHQVKVLDACRYAAKPTFGTWVLGPSDELAISVTVLSLVFQDVNSAQIRLDETRGGRWGRLVECLVRRSPMSSEWAVAGCKTLMIS